jgi:hypothetical protein
MIRVFRSSGLSRLSFLNIRCSRLPIATTITRKNCNTDYLTICDVCTAADEHQRNPPLLTGFIPLAILSPLGTANARVAVCRASSTQCDAATTPEAVCKPRELLGQLWRPTSGSKLVRGG